MNVVEADIRVHLSTRQKKPYLDLALALLARYGDKIAFRFYDFGRCMAVGSVALNYSLELPMFTFDSRTKKLTWQKCPPAEDLFRLFDRMIA